MTMSLDRGTREYDKFVELPDGTTAIRTTANVTVDSMTLNSEMKVDSGHDLYEATTVARTDDLAVSFDAITGLTLAHIQSVENKTKGWMYNTKGATVTDTTLELVAGNQAAGYPVIAVTDEIEIIYRGTSRFTDGTQIAQAYGIYNATEPTLTDGDKAPLQLNENGELKVTGGAGASSVSAEYISPSDFTATYTSSSSITLSGVPISINDSSQIAYIKQVKADNTSRTYVNGANDITLAYSAGVITIYEKGTAAASLVAGDVYEVGINGTTKAYDLSTDANKTISLVNVWNRYTDPEVLVTAQDLTDTYADYGAEIDMRGYTHLRVGIVLDVNDSTDITLKALGLNEAGGIDEFEIEGGTTQAIPHTADAKYSYEFDVKGSPFVQLQAKAETVGAIAGDLTVYITKQFKN